MTPATAAALAALDARLRLLDGLRKALDAGDVDLARHLYDQQPAWVWPASVAAALLERRVSP